MKTIKWTKADAKRAKAGGWKLDKYPGAGYDTWVYSIKRIGNSFKSDDEVIEWVIGVNMDHNKAYLENPDIRPFYPHAATITKALFLCAKG
jgi:hypothetical protein